ncbi:MAG: beta-galactosidase [Verrucomicrobiae bacterium]
MKYPRTILYGGDYNPDQWLDYPGIIDTDFELFKKAHINTVTIGVFAWATLEPEEGRYEFAWMDDIFARAERQGMSVILATPSGAKPNWMALKYPEIRRVTPDGMRDPQKGRHNHCLTSPAYRKKVRAINEQLARRYGQHPSLALWHISNEYGGYCYCDLCMGAFQNWLKQKYGTLDALNAAYWTRFWSHAYTAWDQVRFIDSGVSGLVLDWKRFMTDQCCDFIRNEMEPVRRLSPDVPVTTNLMGTHPDYDYWQIAKELDVVCWDSYPTWHDQETSFHESNAPLNAAFRHDLTRSLKGKPFLLMESTPSQVNWAATSPLLRPGMLRLASLQAIAHGSDSVCYFQLRKSRGSCEQFHGAVIDHVGHGETRVFKEVASLGSSLEKLGGLVGADTPARVAVIFDWENRWVFEASPAPMNREKHYTDTVIAHYKPFWEAGVSVDVVHAAADFSKYDVVVAPLLFMVSEETGARLTEFVERGGTLVTTYGVATVNETGLATLGGVPGPLRKALGIWIEEYDALPDAFRRQVRPVEGQPHGLSGLYEARHYLEMVHAERAETLAVYGDDFYAGQPALTLNRFGKGRAYHTISLN